MDALISNHVNTYDYAGWKRLMDQFWVDDFVYDSSKWGYDILYFAWVAIFFLWLLTVVRRIRNYGRTSIIISI